MEERIIELLISCDWWTHGVVSTKELAPSSSIEEIARYLSEIDTKSKSEVRK